MEVHTILRIKKVTERTGLSKGTIYTLMHRREFPQSIQITEGCVGWVENDVNEWINSRVKKSAAGAA